MAVISKYGMRNLILIVIVLSSGVLCACAHGPATDAQPSGVCAFLGTDLTYIHQSMRDNLAVYQADFDLERRVNQAYNEQKSQVANCRNEKDYVHTILPYFASYHDPHLKPWWQIREGIRPLVKASLGREIRPYQVHLRYSATGLIVKKIGDRYYVRAIDSQLFPGDEVKVGAELRACDGKSIGQVMEQEIIPFQQVSAFEAGLYTNAKLVFFRWDKDPGSITKCEFVDQTQSKNVSLEWKTVGSDYLTRFQEKPGATYAIEKTPYGHWIQLHSLAGYGPEDTALLKRFVDDAKDLRNDSNIVLDLRGNSGGNSSWGEEWIKNLYGYKPKLSNVPNLIYTSPGNIGHYERIFELLDSTGGFSKPKDKDDYKFLLAEMHIHQGRLIPIPEDKKPKSGERKKRTKFHGKLWVISDAWVFSSGELFLQMLRLMPNVTQVGIATDASTQAGEIRFDQTPSGLVFSIGTKVFRSIFVGRKPGEPLKPQVPIVPIASEEFQGRDSTREQLEKMIQHKADH